MKTTINSKWIEARAAIYQQEAKRYSAVHEHSQQEAWNEQHWYDVKLCLIVLQAVADGGCDDPAACAAAAISACPTIVTEHVAAQNEGAS